MSAAHTLHETRLCTLSRTRFNLLKQMDKAQRAYTPTYPAHISSITERIVFDNLETCQSVENIDFEGRYNPEDIYNNPGHLDILVRTSNVKRLSDFMMWQVG